MLKIVSITFFEAVDSVLSLKEWVEMIVTLKSELSHFIKNDSWRSDPKMKIFVNPLMNEIKI